MPDPAKPNRRPLSEAIVRTAKATDKPLIIWDARCPGLGLRVAPGANGKKSWLAMGRKRKDGAWVAAKMTVGTYPAMSLEDARRQSEVVRQAFKGGDTPANLKAAQVKAADERMGRTVDWLVDSYIGARKAAKSPPRSLPEIERQLRKDMLSRWSGRTIDSISRRDVWDLIDGIQAKGQDTKARLLLVAMRGMFRWAVDREYLEGSPARDVKPKFDLEKRERVLSVAELRDVWEATADTSDFSRIVRMLILTGQRRGEVGGMQHAEIDRERMVWTIPADRSKNKLEHEVPLTDAHLAIVDARKRIKDRPFVFGRYDGGAFGGWNKGKLELDTAILERRRGAADLLGDDPATAQPMAHWTLHDLRRTVATSMAEQLNVLPHVIEALLNHVSGHKAGVAGIYNRATYADQKREAIEAWVKFCGGLNVR
jgi:integrase